MSWFKDLFIRKDSHSESIPKMPERKLDISEPVISFVETFKANPKRFKVKTRNLDYLPLGCYYYSLVDKEENLIWDFTCSYIVLHTYIKGPDTITSYPDFITKDEVGHIYNNLAPEFSKRVEKLYEIRKLRTDRLFSRVREDLKKVYCK